VEKRLEETAALEPPRIGRSKGAGETAVRPATTASGPLTTDQERGRAALERRIGAAVQLAVRIGGWDPQTLSPAPRVMEWDVTPHIRGPGRYEISFEYEQGKQRVLIQRVVLCHNGKEVTWDAHPGVAGRSSNLNFYGVALVGVDPRAKYTIRASLRGDRGNNSSGSVWLRPL
jgi:hypothetical protein